MLFDERTAVDAHDFPVWEGLADDAKSLGVEVGLVVGGTEYGTVDDKEIGIGGR